MKNRILVVDDDQDTCDLMEASLSRQGFDVTTRTSALSALAEIATRTFDVVLTDLGMGEMDGLALIERIIGTTPDVPVIVVTGQSTMGAAISALQAGAYDFLTKPIDNKLLLLALGRATRHHSLVQEVKQLREAVASPSTSLVGESEAMKRVLDLVSRVSTSNASVLVVGETGTGKELIARAIHANSPRHAAPFVAINCAAIPQALVDKEGAHAHLTELVVVATMHERKAKMSDLADAFIALPGGFGTLEELFEVITWAQLGIHQKPLGLFDVEGYWDPLVRFIDHAIEEGFVPSDQRALFLVERDPLAMLDALASYDFPVLGRKWAAPEER